MVKAIESKQEWDELVSSPGLSLHPVTGGALKPEHRIMYLVSRLDRDHYQA
jgi:hypothetical protein